MTILAKKYLREEKRKLPKGWRKGRRMKALNYVYIVLGVCMFAAYHFAATDDHKNQPHPFESFFEGSDGGRRLADEDDHLCYLSTDTPEMREAKRNSNSTELMDIDIFTCKQKKNGAIILHIWGILVMFYCIAILCDNYFEPALECICEVFNLEEDVAGATFMAAGGSAPELATSLLGVFVTKSDIGIGTIVGSAVFNVLFVIAVCALLAPNLELTWWPLARDCTFYCISILVLTFTILDNEVNLVESIILFGMYLLYVVLMAYNQKAHKFVERNINDHDVENRPLICRAMHHLTISNGFEIFIYCVIILNLIITVMEPTETSDLLNTICALIFIIEWLMKTFALGFWGYWLDVMNAFDGVLVMLIIVEFILQSADNIASAGRTARLFRFFRIVRIIRVIRLYKTIYAQKAEAQTQTTPRLWGGEGEDEAATAPGTSATSTTTSTTPNDEAGSDGVVEVKPADEKDASEGAKPDGEFTELAKVGGGAKVVPEGEGGGDKEGEDGEGDDDDDGGPFDPFEIPDGKLGMFIWGINLPVVLLMWMVIPDCQRENRKSWFAITFLNCILTIAILAYVMVWMATLFGRVANIPDPVMGLTFLAAGTSIPDALSSLAVARKGFGDMAVSSSVGSNIFDILVGLPIPWFLANAINGDPVEIASDGIAIMIITLFIMVALVVTSIRSFNWKLVKKLGQLYLFLYLVFVVMALMLEYGLLF